MKKIIRILILVLCIGVLVYNANYVYKWYNENKSASTETDDAISIFEDEEETVEKELAELAKKAKTEKQKKELAKKEAELRGKSLNKVQKKYKNVVGFLRVSGTKVKYFVTQYKNNSFYLTHSLDGKYNSAGNPFLDYRNKLDDQALVIYGHNRLDNSQFGNLKNVRGKPNTKITFTTKDGTNQYKIFSTYIIKNESYFNRVSFNNKYDMFLRTITKRSQYNYNVKVTDKDKILTLSTCYGASRLNKRFVVHAKLLK